MVEHERATTAEDSHEIPGLSEEESRKAAELIQVGLRLLGLRRMVAKNANRKRTADTVHGDS
jgi:hypothetical protein